jgi:hypothetical protein
MAMSSASLNIIEAVELFKGCRRSNLKRMRGLGTTVVLPPGLALCVEGERGSEFFVLLEGVVDVRKPGRRIAWLHSGGWFGETALMHNVGRQASVTSATTSTVIVFDPREFSGLCDTAPLVRERLERTAALYLCGEEPLAEPWYEPMGRRATAPSNPRPSTAHRRNTPRTNGRQRTVPVHGSGRLL